jgi:tetratricopeptide (TPR) repeat protein
MNRRSAFLFASLSLALTGCGSLLPHLWGGGARSVDPHLPPGVEAISLLGDTLRELPLSPETRSLYERQLAEARAAYDHAPTDVDSIIWLGRRLAYLGRFREAIAVYSRGIDLYPDDPRLYRHRGHRYISVREFNNAIVDLERAARLAELRPDEIEPDGQPNARNMPLGSLRSNIYYHLGLAYYLKGEFARAIPIYRRELQDALNDDRRVSAGNWYYMCLRRLGRAIEAAQFLRRYSRDMDVVENRAYYRLMLMYKGEIPADSLANTSLADGASVTDVTTAYGVANWHLYNGRRDEAERLFRRILETGQWGAFGYIAAEAELARMRGITQTASRPTRAPARRTP